MVDNFRTPIIFVLLVFTHHISSMKVLKLSASVKPEDNVKVEIRDSSIDKLDQFSICGRFRTPYLPAMKNKMQTLLYRKKLWLLNRLDMVSCDERYPGCTDYYKRAIGQENWLTGDARGTIFHGAYSVFPLWKPNVWNTFCVEADTANKSYATFLNDEAVQISHHYDGIHQNEPGNLFLLNGFSFTENLFVYPFQAEITDVHIWDKTLSVGEIRTWSTCESNQQGTFLKWDEADISIDERIQTSEISKDELCKVTDSAKYLTFTTKMPFHHSIKYCANLGGQIAVAKDFEHLKKMKDSRGKNMNDGCPESFFSGFENNNGWRDADNGDELSWDNWSEIKSSYNGCAVVDKEMKFKKDICTMELCPICHFNNWPSELQLRGMSLSETDTIDTGYYLINSSHLIGKSRSFLKNTQSKWALSTIEGKLVFSKSGLEIPLGINNWNQENIDNGTVRLMLHKNISQPGHFCCDDGSCISSDQVCDSVMNCHDNSDERACQKVLLSKNYNKDNPPRSQALKKVTDHYFKIETWIEITEIINVNQELGEMSIFLKLRFMWFDDNLKFQFLGDDFKQNVLNSSTESLIWIPVTDYMYLIEKRVALRRLTIRKNTRPSLSGDVNSLQPWEVYEGSENYLRLTTYERIKVLCSFDKISEYPFGVDDCEFDLYLNDNDNRLATFEPIHLGIC